MGSAVSSIGNAVGSVFGGASNGVQGFFGSALGVGRSGNVSGQGYIDDTNAMAQQNAQTQMANMNAINPQQQEFAKKLADRANGNTPSIAEAQMKAAQDRNLSQQLAAAKSNKSVNPALQQRQLQNLSAQQGQQTAQASATMKLQEDAMNQQMFGNYLNQQQQNTNAALGRGQSAAESLYGAQMGKRASDINMMGNVFNQMGGGMMSGMMSDKNVKTDIKKASSKPGKKEPKTNYSEGGMLETAMKLAPLAMMAFSDENVKTNVKRANSEPGVKPQKTNYSDGGMLETAMKLAPLAMMMFSDEQTKTDINQAKSTPGKKEPKTNFSSGGMPDFAHMAGDGNTVYVPRPGHMFEDYLAGIHKAANSSKVAGGREEKKEGGGGGQAPSGIPGMDELGSGEGTMMAGGPFDEMGAAGGGGLLDMSGGAVMMASNGGKVPGRAPVPGDSPKNDIVNAKLSPGEMVIPRTVVNKGPDAVKQFADKTEEENFNPKSFLDALTPYSYKYKNPNMPGAGEGRHLSVMAQDLEKAGPVGASMVMNTPNGKMVDYGKGFGAILAAQADLNARLAEIESRYGSRKK